MAMNEYWGMEQLNDPAGQAHEPLDDDESELEDLSDALGQDLLQTYLEMAYANYIRQSARNLIGYVYRSSPLVGRHRIAEKFE